jgi:hypothetical protein
MLIVNKNALFVSMLMALLMAFNLWAFNIVHSYSVEGVFIDVYTQKGGKGLNMPSDAFDAQENVTLYAEVTNNDVPVPNKVVEFEIHGPTNLYENISIFRNATTNASGVASTSFRIPLLVEHWREKVFGTWNVSAITEFGEQIIADTVTFECGWIIEIILVETGTLLDGIYWIPRINFTIEEQVSVKLIVKNIAFTAKNVTIILVCYDSQVVPINQWVGFHVIPEKTTEDIFIQIGPIPKYASMGSATIYANVFTGLPWEDGIQYCPEISAELLIVEEIEDTTPPSIGEPACEPELVQPDQEVTVSVNVTDTQTGVREVILSYSVDGDDAWINIIMNKTIEDTFVGSIPGFAAGTLVQFRIVAYDYAGNPTMNNNAGQYYVYMVVPEFKIWPSIVLTLFLLTVITILTGRRIKHNKGVNIPL